MVLICLFFISAFLEDGDVNVIVLDWHRLANRNYITARNGVPGAGRGLGQFINWLASLGVSYDSMHLVGFSLGAHLVGNAGRETGSKVRRITGKGHFSRKSNSCLTGNNTEIVEAHFVQRVTTA